MIWFKKMAKNLKRHFTKGKRMANKYMKRWPTSSVNNDFQNKEIKKYYYLQKGWAKEKI